MPPCIMVSGSDYFGVNHIVPAPISHDGTAKQTLSARMYTIDVPLATDDIIGWKPYPIFRGSTPNLQSITCHVSALIPGCTPHPPHQHREEEILLLLRGEVEVTLPGLEEKGMQTTVPLKAGEFVYYPAWFHHTITAVGTEPANYLMFKWYNAQSRDMKPGLQYQKYDVSDYFKTGNSEKLFQTRLLFKGATDCLFALQSHTSVVLPGGGYASHTDAHDVAIVVLKGEIEVLGERAGPFGVFFFPSGQMHDMHNPSSAQAEYLVFEFHGNHVPPVKRMKRTLWVKIRDPKSWKQKFSELKTRFT